MLVGAVGEFNRDVGGAEIFVDREDQIVHWRGLRLQSAFRDERVRIKRARRSPTLPAAQAGPSRDASTLDRLGAPGALYVPGDWRGHTLSKSRPKKF
jgi:hypothetical protein